MIWFIKKILRKFFSIMTDNFLVHFFSSAIVTFIRYADGNYGNKKRYNYYKKHLKFLGKGVIIDTGVFITGGEYISIGDDTHIDKNCILVGAPPDLDLSSRYIKTRENSAYTGSPGEINIGKNCHISQNTMIYGYGGVSIDDNSTMSAGSKIYSLTSIAYNPYNRSEIVSIVPYSGKSPTLIGPVVLGKNVWIGIDSIVSPGCTLEENVFAKSHSIINSSFTENSYIGGSPAVKIRNRFDVPKKNNKKITSKRVKKGQSK